MHNFPGQNGTVVGTFREVPSRVVDFGPLAEIVDKNAFRLEAQPRERVFDAILCEKGKILMSSLPLQDTPAGPY